MLQALNSEVLMALACILSARASGGMSESKTWTCLNAVCIPKVLRDTVETHYHGVLLTKIVFAHAAGSSSR